MPSKNKTTQPKIKTLQTVKGMKDILPQEQPVWDKLARSAREIADFYNFLPITTPIVEPSELFNRAAGETSDVVEKEMFNLKTKGGDALVLRPEGTAGVARAYIQNGLNHMPHPLKLFYFGQFFRYEQPQSGRERQFYQIGFELFSHENDPLYDAQVIIASYRLIEDLKIKGVSIHVNSIGCRSCRPNFRKQLVAYYRNKEKKLCGDCKRRLETNPLRLLDCKKPDCATLKEGAPLILDHLCSNCKNHFKGVLEYLEDLKLPYTLDHFLVRGFDYYTKTVFEFFLEHVDGEEDFKPALGGGGRFDYLLESLGGKATPAVGVALGVTPILEVIKRRNISYASRLKSKIFLVHIGDLAKKKSLALIENLRENKIQIAESLGKESMAAQLRTADKTGAPLALIFGQKEAFEESIIIRDMKTGAQETVPIAKLPPAIKRKLG